MGLVVMCGKDGGEKEKSNVYVATNKPKNNYSRINTLGNDWAAINRRLGSESLLMVPFIVGTMSFLLGDGSSLVQGSGLNMTWSGSNGLMTRADSHRWHE